MLPYNFDNVLNAMSTLLMLCTTEEYERIMYAAIGARGIGLQPVKDANPQWAFFFLAVIIFGALFLMRLFVAVVIQHYNTTTTKDDAAHGKAELAAASTTEELSWLNMQEMLLNYAAVEESRLKPPHWACVINRLCFELAYGVGGTFSAQFIYGCILLNTMLMAARHFGQPVEFGEVCIVAQEVFAFIFVIESAVKIIAINTQYAYFKDSWNVFDFVVASGGFCAVLMKHIYGTDGGTFISLLRVLRLGRIARLLKHNKQLRELMGTILLALPPLGSLSAVLVLFYFMYAVMGRHLKHSFREASGAVQLFSKVRLSNEMGRHLNEGYNF
jgi:hypothetical protein